jgi:hypothetical protein
MGRATAAKKLAKQYKLAEKRQAKIAKRNQEKRKVKS